MSDFQVNQRRKQEPSASLFGRVLVSFILFFAGLVLIGTGASLESAAAPAFFVGGILVVGLGYLLPMTTHER
jgi:hypothetical protein